MTRTLNLVRLALRRDRITLPSSILGIAATVVLSGSSIKDLYPSQTDLDKFADAVNGNPALIAVRGRTIGIDTLGGAIAWQVGYFAMILAALMSILLVVRHTRGGEETGRTELILASPVGRFAPLAAAVIVVAAANIVLGAAVTLGMVALGLDGAGSLIFGSSVAAVGLVFTCVAAVTAQLSTTARAASGLAGAILGAAYVLRGIGDVADNWVSWLSPIGWGQAMRPYAGNRWWPLVIMSAATAVILAGASVLQGRRDFAGGLISPRPGPPTASRALTTPLGFAVRLQRGGFVAWALGLFVLGLAYGSLGENIKDLLETSSQAEDIFVQTSGASLVDSYFGTTSLTLALIGTAFTIQAIGRLRSEETGGRAEPVLATALSRWRWAGSHLAVSLGGTVLLLAAAGLGTGLAYGVRGAGVDQIPRLAGAALAQAPAAWVLGSIALLVFGFAPRASVVAWLPLAFCFIVGTLGPLLGLPHWVDRLSPYDAQPMLPAESFTPVPLIGLTAVAAVLALAGLAAFRRRDIG